MTLPLVLALALVQTVAPIAQQSESPFVCNLGVLTAADRARKEDISHSLAAMVTGVRELPDGFEFQFTSEPATLTLLGEWTWTERLCCPFFDFDIRVDREGGPIALRLTGRPGTKAFIEADFVRWIQDAHGAAAR